MVTLSDIAEKMPRTASYLQHKRGLVTKIRGELGQGIFWSSDVEKNIKDLGRMITDSELADRIGMAYIVTMEKTPGAKIDVMQSPLIVLELTEKPLEYKKVLKKYTMVGSI